MDVYRLVFALTDDGVPPSVKAEFEMNYFNQQVCVTREINSAISIMFQQFRKEAAQMQVNSFKEKVLEEKSSIMDIAEFFVAINDAFLSKVTESLLPLIVDVAKIVNDVSVHEKQVKVLNLLHTWIVSEACSKRNIIGFDELPVENKKNIFAEELEHLAQMLWGMKCIIELIRGHSPRKQVFLETICCTNVELNNLRNGRRNFVSSYVASEDGSLTYSVCRDKVKQTEFFEDSNVPNFTYIVIVCTLLLQMMIQRISFCVTKARLEKNGSKIESLGDFALSNMFIAIKKVPKTAQYVAKSFAQVKEKTDEKTKDLCWLMERGDETSDARLAFRRMDEAKALSVLQRVAKDDLKVESWPEKVKDFHALRKLGIQTISRMFDLDIPQITEKCKTDRHSFHTTAKHYYLGLTRDVAEKASKNLDDALNNIGMSFDLEKHQTDELKVLGAKLFGRTLELSKDQEEIIRSTAKWIVESSRTNKLSNRKE